MSMLNIKNILHALPGIALIVVSIAGALNDMNQVNELKLSALIILGIYIITLIMGVLLLLSERTWIRILAILISTGGLALNLKESAELLNYKDVTQALLFIIVWLALFVDLLSARNTKVA